MITKQKNAYVKKFSSWKLLPQNHRYEKELNANFWI